MLVVAGGAAAATAGVLPGVPGLAPASGKAASAAPEAEVRTEDIEQRTMRTAADLDGTLGYEDASDVAAGTEGTVTRLPDEGSIIERGGVLYELDGKVPAAAALRQPAAVAPARPGVRTAPTSSSSSAT